MKRSSGILLSVLLAILAGMVIYSQKKRLNVREAKVLAESVKGRPIVQDSVVKTPSNYHWKDVSREEMDEFAALFQGKGSGRGYELDATVNSGESIVANVYEAKPGEYICSKLTPKLTRDKDGKAVVTVEVESFGVGEDGVRDQIVKSKQTYPGSFYQLTFRDSGGNYLLSLQTEVGEGDVIRLKSTGEYQKFTSPVPVK